MITNIMHRWLKHTASWRLLFAVIGLCVFMALPVLAQTSQPADVCTDGPQFTTDVPAGTPGLITSVATGVQTVMMGLSEAMFTGIVGDGSFTSAAQAALTLYIAIYGILFTFGMTEITVFDFITRMMKVGIIVILLSDSAWWFFSNYVVIFFNTATDELINKVSSIAFGTLVPIPADCANGFCTGPLAVLDQAVSKALSANMWVHLAATTFTSPYGLAHSLLMGIALWSFLGTLLTGIWVYLMSLVIRGLLFGLAPIFLVCLMFNRTRHLFDGWLNQVINACLQPILLFTFFAFFLVLVQSSIDRIINVPVCWTEASESMRGTPFNFHFWRYKICNPTATTGAVCTAPGGASGRYEPYGGSWGWNGAAGGGPTFPIDIVDVLIFFILAELGKRFSQVVLMIARDLAGAATDLSSQNPFDEMFNFRGGRGGHGGAGAAGARVNPDGTRGGGGGAPGVPAAPPGTGVSAKGQASPTVGVR